MFFHVLFDNVMSTSFVARNHNILSFVYTQIEILFMNKLNWQKGILENTILASS